jgi:hypothetical protein
MSAAGAALTSSTRWRDFPKTRAPPARARRRGPHPPRPPTEPNPSRSPTAHRRRHRPKHPPPQPARHRQRGLLSIPNRPTWRRPRHGRLNRLLPQHNRHPPRRGPTGAALHRARGSVWPNHPPARKPPLSRPFRRQHRCLRARRLPHPHRRSRPWPSGQRKNPRWGHRRPATLLRAPRRRRLQHRPRCRSS